MTKWCWFFTFHPFSYKRRWEDFRATSNSMDRVDRGECDGGLNSSSARRHSGLKVRKIDYVTTLLTGECIWFKCGLYLRFIAPNNLWKICIDLRPFSKCFRVPFLRTLRSPRSNNLEIQNDENSKWKLVKTRWNPNFGLSDLENDHLTSLTSKEAQWGE